MCYFLQHEDITALCCKYAYCTLLQYCTSKPSCRKMTVKIDSNLKMAATWHAVKECCHEDGGFICLFEKMSKMDTTMSVT